MVRDTLKRRLAWLAEVKRRPGAGFTLRLKLPSHFRHAPSMWNFGGLGGWGPRVGAPAKRIETCGSLGLASFRANQARLLAALNGPVNRPNPAENMVLSYRTRYGSDNLELSGEYPFIH